jgi:hypothetical protein
MLGSMNLPYFIPSPHSGGGTFGDSPRFKFLGVSKLTSSGESISR